MDNGYDPSEGIMELASASGYDIFNLSIDVSGRSETEVALLRQEAERLGKEIKNPPLILREGNRLAVFAKRI